MRAVVTACLICVTGALLCVAAEETPLTKQLRELDSRVIVLGTVRQPPLASMLSRHAEARLRQANRASTAEWEKIKTRADWEAFRREKLQALKKSLGEFPEPPRNLKVKVTGSHAGDGYHVDNLVYESRPGLVVTANLYRPTKGADSHPGIIICHSHQSTKHSGWRQDMGMTWARAGCTVLIPDHLGHGERRQHPFGGEGQHDYHFRYDLGMQLHLVGESLMGWLVWDLMRGVDVLLQQPGVDAKRIVMISEPAGGGDVAAVTGALDERISCVMVQNFGGPQPETPYPLPSDAEESFAYAGSGSWESTRNLRLSARDGFLPWVIVASIAPRKLIYFHEFYWDQWQDPVWKRLQKVYSSYEKPTQLVGLAGRGFVVGSAPENTHWLPESRELLYPTLENWFQIPNPGTEYSQRLAEEDLRCLTTEFVKENRMELIFGFGRHLNAQRTPPAYRQRPLTDRWELMLGEIAPRTPNLHHTVRPPERLGNITVERLHFSTEPGILVPALLLLPEAQPDRKLPLVIGVAQQGKQTILQERSEEIAGVLSAGVAVCLVDVRGTGETSPGDEHDRRSAATSISASELMLGHTLLGARLKDLRSVLKHLRTRPDLDMNRLVLWGESFVESTSRETDFNVPHSAAKRPPSPEPLGGLLVLLTALYEPEVRGVFAHRGLVSFRSKQRDRYCYLPHDVVIPDAAVTGDVDELVAALAPREVLLHETVDGSNRLVLSADFFHADIAYQAARAKEKLRFDFEPATPQKTAGRLIDLTRD